MNNTFIIGNENNEQNRIIVFYFGNQDKTWGTIEIKALGFKEEQDAISSAQDKAEEVIDQDTVAFYGLYGVYIEE